MAIDDRLAQIVSTQGQLRDMQDQLRKGLTGGDGAGGGMSDDWKDSVDRQLGQLHGDVRHLLYALIGGAVLLLGAGATAYVKLSDQITQGRVEQAAVSGKLDLILKQLEDQSTKPAK